MSHEIPSCDAAFQSKTDISLTIFHKNYFELNKDDKIIVDEIYFSQTDGDER